MPDELPPPAPNASEDPVSFRTLIHKERAWIDANQESARSGSKFWTSTPGVAGEPWVHFTARDYFGIALSGGGIRSATFNLGLLQALENKNVLKRADYLSTVSGGGYVGGFLSAWRQHHGEAGESFPLQTDPADASEPTPMPPTIGPNAPIKPPATPRFVPDMREPRPIRHLREFSRFLMPRMGIFQTETWSAIVTILGGLLPSIAAAFAVLVCGTGVWLLAARTLSNSSPTLGAALIALITLLLMTWSEVRHSRAGEVVTNEKDVFAHTATAAAAAVGFVWLFVGQKGGTPPWLMSTIQWLRSVFGITPLPGAPTSGTDRLIDWLTANFNLWAKDWPQTESKFASIGGAFAPALAWVGVAALLLFLRAFTSRFGRPRPNWSATTDRVVAVCLAAALGWTLLAGLWAVARALLHTSDPRTSAGAVGLGAVGTGGLFVWVRDWLKKPVEETNGSSLLKKVADLVRPKIPQILAALTVLLLIVIACLALQKAIGAGFLRFTLGGAVIIVAATLLFFDPARVGMHDFYRARICRCFLGAARADDDDYFRGTTEQVEDEVELGDLLQQASAPDHPHRTLHLVCCTANNLAGDVLGGLYRGGRSAVLSPHGIALGNYHGELNELRLSSALTASAAAFNSQMGRLSIDFGPAVGFLMSALNLRLGLWVPHPLNPNRHPAFFRGLPFFFEMFGWTNCDVAASEIVAPGQQKTRLQRLSDKGRELKHRLHDLHLSDGGHFENLGLYELVRRHCRYIIVSDCGADPEVAFDDLAIALRTIREDFGVEIDLDVSPLRRDANGRARQHAVIGTIHYDGLTGLDKGTLLYFKPGLTGDEPPDVLQYQSRNPAFPHESTGDQFYDEPQWESYRRLGQHAGNVVFRFIESYGAERIPTTHTATSANCRFLENVFRDARAFWHPAPERQSEAFLAMTDRCAALEKEIRESAPAFLCSEFFPEAGIAHGGASVRVSSRAAPTVEEETHALYFLMLVAQIMEDVWVSAELDAYWSHPLNDGWMNYFHRWASTPSFRRWWPILQPIFSIGFRQFVRERFDLGYARAGRLGGAMLELRDQNSGNGLAWRYWHQRKPKPFPHNQPVLEFWLRLDPEVTVGGTSELLVGILVYHPKPESQIIEWQSENLFVPHSLNGAGFTARFLDAIIAHFEPTAFRQLHVVFDPKKARPDPANRLRQLHDVNFYKSREFLYETPTPPGEDLRLVRDLKGRQLAELLTGRATDFGGKPGLTPPQTPKPTPAGAAQPLPVSPQSTPQPN